MFKHNLIELLNNKKEALKAVEIAGGPILHGNI